MVRPWRQSSGDYFETTINCLSEEERSTRIADLESRGFELVRCFERADRFSQDVSGSGRRRHKGTQTDASYGAVLRRYNK